MPWIPPGTFQDGLDAILPNGDLTFPAFSSDPGSLRIREWMRRIWLHGFITGQHDLGEHMAEAGLRRFDAGIASPAEHEALLGNLDALLSPDSVLSRFLRYDSALQETPDDYEPRDTVAP